MNCVGQEDLPGLTKFSAYKSDYVMLKYFHLELISEQNHHLMWYMTILYILTITEEFIL